MNANDVIFYYSTVSALEGKAGEEEGGPGISVLPPYPPPDWVDDVELAGVCSSSGGHSCALRWLSFHPLPQCALGPSGQAGVSARSPRGWVDHRVWHPYSLPSLPSSLFPPPHKVSPSWVRVPGGWLPWKRGESSLVTPTPFAPCTPSSPLAPPSSHRAMTTCTQRSRRMCC